MTKHGGTLDVLETAPDWLLKRKGQKSETRDYAFKVMEDLETFPEDAEYARIEIPKDVSLNGLQIILNGLCTKKKLPFKATRNAKNGATDLVVVRQKPKSEEA